tara:strand:+ start:1349 stop:1849 length:501 start_codon:yes stop_codon:yes gene_type:complete
MIKMVLSPAEILCAKFLGITRQMMKFGTRTSNARVSKKDDVQINYEGALGEVAVSKFLCVDLQAEGYTVGDDGVDMVSDGVTIDVKWSTTGHLYFGKPMRADVAVMTCPGSDYYVVNIMGWISKDEFSKKSFSQQFGNYPKVKAVRIDQLRIPDTLQKWIKTRKKN